MKYFIRNEKNEFDKEQFESLLYDACRCDVLNNPAEMVPKFLPFKEKEFIHEGVLLKTLQMYYNESLKKINNGEKVLVDDVHFYIEKEEENE